MDDNIINNSTVTDYLKANNITKEKYQYYINDDKKILFRELLLNSANDKINPELITVLLNEFSNDTARMIFLQEVFTKHNQHLDNCIKESLINFPETYSLMSCMYSFDKPIDVDNLNLYEQQFILNTRHNTKQFFEIKYNFKTDTYTFQVKDREAAINYIHDNMQNFISKTIVQRIKDYHKDKISDFHNQPIDTRMPKKIRRNLNCVEGTQTAVEQQIATNRSSTRNKFYSEQGSPLPEKSIFIKETRDLLSNINVNVVEPIAKLNCLESVINTTKDYIGKSQIIELSSYFEDRHNIYKEIEKSILSITEDTNLIGEQKIKVLNKCNLLLQKLEPIKEKFETEIKAKMKTKIKSRFTKQRQAMAEESLIGDRIELTNYKQVNKQLNNELSQENELSSELC